MHNPRQGSPAPERILVVSGSDKGAENLISLLESNGFGLISRAKSCDEARRYISDTNFDIIIINAPLPDESGQEFAVDISRASIATGVIFIVKSELAPELCEELGRLGVFVLAKPISQTVFVQSLKDMTALLAKLKVFRSETDMLRVKIDELRIVDRAKCILMQYLKMSEKQSHRYIEKQAMDLRITKREAAENILKTYEQ